MSVSYWMIEGIGLNADDVAPHINKEKAVRFFLEQLPEESDLADMIAANDYSSFDIEEYYYGNGFENLADILCHCDDTDSLTFGDDGDGGAYFYYPPSMPWHHTSNEPQTEQEVIDRIIKAVQKITDMTEDEIKKIIDNDLYVVGCG